MKKILLALMAVGFASLASAAPTAISSGAEINTTACPVLGESVRINLSANVSGAYDCSEVRNAINVGACHASGTRSNSLVCAQTGADEDGDPVFNNSACNADNVGETITIAAASYRGFRASTTGGSVAPQSLSGNCAAGTAQELVNFQ